MSRLRSRRPPRHSSESERGRAEHHGVRLLY
jgi:hypothetical protein